MRRLQRLVAVASLTLVLPLLAMGAWLSNSHAAGPLLFPDKEVTGRVVKVDVRKMTLVIKTDEENKTYKISEDTKFIGPLGGVSEAGIKDDRLKAGAEVTLVVAGNNKTVREVHLPRRKSKD
jgi:hypothetical protein